MHEAYRTADVPALLAAWRAEGAVAPDSTPSLYLYAQRFRLPDGTTREAEVFASVIEVDGRFKIYSFITD